MPTPYYCAGVLDNRSEGPARTAGAVAPAPFQPLASALPLLASNHYFPLTRQIITPTLHKQQLGLKHRLQLLERMHIGGNIFPDRSVRASTCLDGADSGSGEGFVPDEEFLVFLSRKKG
jgi:hypothetical protein